jgi:hypothetical protein
MATKKAAGSSKKSPAKKSAASSTKKASTTKSSAKKASTKKASTTKAPAKAATKKAPARKASSKRTLIEPHPGDKRYIRRDAQGRIKESDDVGRSLAADRRTKAKTASKSGQGDKGDRKPAKKK